MGTLLGFLFFISFIALVVGLISPKLVIRWGDNKTRKQVLLVYGLASLFFIVLGTIINPAKEEKNISSNSTASTTIGKASSDKTKKLPKATTTTLPSVATTTKPSQSTTTETKAKVVGILANSINHYKQLLSQGKSILGTTQYADANAGLTAMNDPNSAAVKFGAFKNGLDKGDNLNEYYNAYVQASDYLSSKNISGFEDILNDWNDNMGQADSDLHLWATHAVDWQISNYSNADLRRDEQKFLDDLSKASADIAKIK